MIGYCDSCSSDEVAVEKYPTTDAPDRSLCAYCAETLIGRISERTSRTAEEGWHKESLLILAQGLNTLERRILEAMRKPDGRKLIGWRSADYLFETADEKIARNWQANMPMLPIFEGDPHTKLGKTS